MTAPTPRQAHMNTSPLPFQQFQRELLVSLRDPCRRRAPRGVPIGRWRVYRELLFNKIEASLAACFPISRALLGPRAWTRLVKAFIAEHRCVRPCYREIPDELMHYLQERGLANRDPPCLFELAHYEWIELVLMIAEAEAPADVDPASDLLADTPVLTSVLSLSCYRFPVQEIRPDRRGWTEWRKRTVEDDAQPTFVLGFRNADDEVRFITVSAVTAALIQRLIDHGPIQTTNGRDILSQLAEESRHPDPERFLAYGAATLSDLRQQGAIVGVRRASTRSNERLQGA